MEIGEGSLRLENNEIFLNIFNKIETKSIFNLLKTPIKDVSLGGERLTMFKDDPDFYSEGSEILPAASFWNLRGKTYENVRLSVQI